MSIEMQNPRISESAKSNNRNRIRTFASSTLLLLGLLAIPIASAQTNPPAPKCISLASSKMCPAFNTSHISLENSGKFPFLKFVSNTEQFDKEFERYIRTDYPVAKFQNEFGCVQESFSNTTNLYARYTKSQLCSAMIQESIKQCQLTPENAKPLCLEDCSLWASSEWQIVSDKDTCGETKVRYDDIIRSDFTICTLPDNTFKRGLCMNADLNEGDNCGFSENLPALCLHCQGGTVNSTETCCYEADVEKRCQGVKLPIIRDVPAGLLPTPSAVPESKKNKKAVSGGAIAGIVIGAMIALAVIVFLIFWLRRRRQMNAQATYLNRPTPKRTTPERPVQYNNSNNPIPPVTPQNQSGGRIARMSALESNNTSITGPDSPPPMPLQERTSHRVINNTSGEFDLQDTPDTRRSAKYTGTPDHRPLHPPPRDRNASLSSTSILVSDRNHSDSEKEDGTLGSPVSEQLPYFKDYYSKDDIHPHDKVAVLWAYSPRAGDEFELERGDMLKVIGIWDDGWATGIRINERAEDYVRARTQRDSGISASQLSRASMRPSTPTGNRDVKAFPLVCVCLPEHWHKTIENDGIDYTSTHTTEGQLSDPETTPGKRIQNQPSSRFREDMNPRGGPSSP
ncbi:hypothetical protein DFH27DRAFT_354517 [Peziza echinospora]|nr:hypothetical protein DFH27DRAFT_354517 [Peziza echinospora]